jgi:Low-density lipoprotein receptor domain class A
VSYFRDAVNQLSVIILNIIILSVIIQSAIIVWQYTECHYISSVIIRNVSIQSAILPISTECYYTKCHTWVSLNWVSYCWVPLFWMLWCQWVKLDELVFRCFQNLKKYIFLFVGGGVRERCTSDQFQCGENGKCIPLRWQCDFHRDCEEGQDEYDCRKFISLP